MMSDKKITVNKIKMIINNTQFNSSDKIEQITLPHVIEIPEEWQVNEKTMLFYILKRLCEEENKYEDKIQEATNK